MGRTTKAVSSPPCENDPLTVYADPYDHPLSDGGKLALDCPQMPNTTPVDNLTPDYKMGYFAWNSFIALNWPALVDGNSRGIADLTKHFATAADGDTAVWETFKEKREVYYQGRCENKVNDSCEHPSSSENPNPLADQCTTLANYPIYKGCNRRDMVFNTGPHTAGERAQCTPDIDFVSAAGPQGALGRCQLNLPPYRGSCENDPQRPCGTDADCDSSTCNLGVLPTKRAVASLRWAGGHQYGPEGSHGGALIDRCPPTPPNTEHEGELPSRMIPSTIKTPTFDAVSAAHGDDLDETVEVFSEARELGAKLCQGEPLPYRCSGSQKFCAAEAPCGEGGQCLQYTSNDFVGWTDFCDPLNQRWINTTGQAPITPSDYEPLGLIYYGRTGDQRLTFRTAPDCCTIRGQPVTPRVWTGTEESEARALRYEVKVNYDYFDYVVSNQFHRDRYRRPAAKNTNQKFRLPWRSSGTLQPNTNNFAETTSWNAETALRNHGYQKLCTRDPRKDCSSDPHRCKEGLKCETLGPDGTSPGNPLLKLCEQEPRKECSTHRDCGGDNVCETVPSSIGAIHIKAAWRRLKAEDDHSRYRTTRATYYAKYPGDGPHVDPSINRTSIQQRICKEVDTFGLVGFHIIQRTHQHYGAGNFNPLGGTYIFATWEHEDNDSEDMDYRYADFRFPGPGLFQKGLSTGQFFPNITAKVCSNDYQRVCQSETDCVVGHGVTCEYKNENKKNLENALKLKRLVPRSAATEAVNVEVHDALSCSTRDSVWCHYKLTGIQFQAAEPHDESVNGTFTGRCTHDTQILCSDDSACGAGGACLQISDGNGQQDYNLANLVLESNLSLQNFSGRPANSVPIEKYKGKCSHDPKKRCLFDDTCLSNDEPDAYCDVDGQNSGVLTTAGIEPGHCYGPPVSIPSRRPEPAGWLHAALHIRQPSGRETILLHRSRV